jgi:hypothetical protein
MTGLGPERFDPFGGAPPQLGGPTSAEFVLDDQGEPTFEVGEDGSVVEMPILDADAIPVKPQDEGFGANLAEVMDDSELSLIASELLDAIEDDIEARKPWADRFKRGLEMMGLVSNELDDGPFPGSATAINPLISEAIVQFWARAQAELVPAEGPARAKVMGKQSEAILDRARRVEQYLNHEILFIDESWYQEHSRLTFAIPFAGCAFKKVYRDHAMDRNVSVYVPAEDFIVPSNVTDLKSAHRFSHRIWRSPNEMRKLQVAGIYRDIDLNSPGDEDASEETSMRIETQDVDGSGDNIDARHELFEIYVERDLEGFEDPNGIALPYVITVERESRQILSIYRNWKEQDPLQRRRVPFVKYSYIPGLAFYDLGLFHLIGGLQEAATGALRELLDAGAMASLQGGFVSRDANLREERLEIEPGKWKVVDATSEDLAKAFFTPPFREPSPALFQLLSFLTSRAEKFTSTTELMTGDTNAKAPVGSTVAVIEQAGKVFSTIHRGMHMAMAQELRLRLALVQEYMPVEGYPYDVDGMHEGVLAEDFAPGVSIQPVSDPNIFSSAQRVAIAQSVYEMATQNPDIIKKDVAVRRVLEAIRVPDVDELMVVNEPTPPPKPMDPISEVQSLLRQEPVQAYPDQLHEAHLAHYVSFMQNPGFGGNPQIKQQVGPALMALVGQRLAYLWATHARSFGAPVDLLPPPIADPNAPPPDAMGGMMPPDPSGMAGPPGMPGMSSGAPPEFIAQMAAQISPQMVQAPGLPPEGGSEAEAPMAGADAAAAMSSMTAQMTAEAKAAEGQAKMQRSQAELMMASQMHQMKMQHEQELHAVKMAREQDLLALGQAKSQSAQTQAAVKAQAAYEAAELARNEHLQRAQAEQIAAEQSAIRQHEQMLMDRAQQEAQMRADAERAELEQVVTLAKAQTQARAAKPTIAKGKKRA